MQSFLLKFTLVLVTVLGCSFFAPSPAKAQFYGGYGAAAMMPHAGYGYDGYPIYGGGGFGGYGYGGGGALIISTRNFTIGIPIRQRSFGNYHHGGYGYGGYGRYPINYGHGRRHHHGGYGW